MVICLLTSLLLRKNLLNNTKQNGDTLKRMHVECAHLKMLVAKKLHLTKKVVEANHTSQVGKKKVGIFSNDVTIIFGATNLF